MFCNSSQHMCFDRRTFNLMEEGQAITALF